MEITFEQLSVWRAESMWDTALDLIFKQVDRRIYHQYMEILEPVRLWKGKFTLRGPESQLDTIAKKYQPVILSALQKQSTEVEKIHLLGLEEKEGFHAGDKQGWIVEQQLIQTFWEQVMDQLAKQVERDAYMRMQKYVQPLAMVNRVFLVGMDHYGIIIKDLVESELLQCVQHVDLSIESLEFVEIDKMKTKDKKTIVKKVGQTPQNHVAGKELWAEVLSKLSKQISRPSFQTWLLPTEFVACENETLTIRTPNKFSRDWIESRYWNVIKEQIKLVNPSIKWIKVISAEENGQRMILDDSLEKREFIKSNDLGKRLDQIEAKLEKILQML